MSRSKSGLSRSSRGGPGGNLGWNRSCRRDPDDLDSDPICEFNDLKDAGDGREACKILMELCRADLRCLDAHAHFGNFVFDHSPKDTIRHCEAGLRIGGLSFGPAFDGLGRPPGRKVIPWPRRRKN